MATEFELIIAQPDVDAAYAGQVAEAVFTEIDRMEDELSRFKSGSDIWHINHLRTGESCRIGMAARDCLMLAFAVHAETGGAFDITVGPLMNIFRNDDGTPRMPSAGELAEARLRLGPQIITLDEDGLVTANVDSPSLDLGAIGKGYALDQAVTVLHDHGVQHALLNAGDSTVLGLGAPPGEKGWTVTAGNAAPAPLLLRNLSLSASGFAVKGAHIMDARRLRPVPMRQQRLWVCAPTAALSDALSTAFTVMEPDEIRGFCEHNPGIEAILD